MITEFIDFLDKIIWSPPLVFGLLITGLIFSLITRFAQVRQFKEMLRLLFKGEKSPQGISSFQAISLSLAGRVGTGNIVGVSAAIFIGGPGAVFWMWVTALLGASTAFVESTLGQIYKQKENGEYRGGPAYYIENEWYWRKVRKNICVNICYSDYYFNRTFNARRTVQCNCNFIT